MTIRRSQVLSDLHNYCCNLNTREIFLHGHFAEEHHGIDFKQAVVFEKNIRLLEDQSKDILIHLHSEIGGNYYDGMAIYDNIICCKSPTIILAHAVVYSMSSVIFQATTKRILMPNCDMLVHFGWLESCNTSLGLISEACQEKYRQYKILKIFANRCINGAFFQKKNYTNEQCMKLIQKQICRKGDWWLTPEQALDLGFCDGIYGTKGFSSIEEIRTKDLI